MKSTYQVIFSLALFVPICLSQGQAAEEPQFGEEFDQVTVGSDALGVENCSVHRITSETVEGDVEFYTDLKRHPEFHRFDSLNGTTWDYWFFDGVSPDSETAFTIAFFRDGAGAPKGKTNSLAMMEARLPDGELHTAKQYFDESVLKECDSGAVKSVWRSSSSGEEEAALITFEISESMDKAVVAINTPTVQGTLNLQSRSNPRFANGEPYPSEAADAFLVPGLSWIQPVPGGDVDVDLQVNGKAMAFSGAGGHERFWATHTWLQLAQGWQFLRFRVGPYILSFCNIISDLHPGVTYPSVYLEYEKEKVFASRSDRISLEDDYVLFRPTHTGSLHGVFNDKSTGYQLDLVSPSQNKHWRFNLEHNVFIWKSPTGPDTGNDGFLDYISGGEVSKQQYDKGYGFSGQIQFNNK